MALLTLTSFWLEPDCVERVAFCCMIIISHFLYTTYIPIMVPANGNESPLIVLFFRDSLILVTISLVTAVIVKGLSSASMSPPDWVSDPSYRVIHSVIGHWVLPSELRSKITSYQITQPPSTPPVDSKVAALSDSW
uniref:Neurotransmitter-gated ion-channel transmembrane domain-containing protein n=1 Tax=Timema tahoe TaxID=61484 RepID=A0A7R9IL21_9NEOP|nr:unnamed protein product [Timema tahoe]